MAKALTCIEKQLEIMPLRQQGNACGTTALAMAFHFLGHPVTPCLLDQEIRRGGTFTAMGKILQAAKRHGFAAEVYNQSDFEAIQQHLDADCPIIALVDMGTRANDLALHYVVINGYRISQPGEQWVSVTDPNGGGSRWETYESFVKNKWAHVDVMGLHTGFDCLMVVVSRQSVLPASRWEGVAVETDRIATGMNELGNAWGALKAGELLNAVFLGVIGVTTTLHGAWGYGIRRWKNVLQRRQREFTR